MRTLARLFIIFTALLAPEVAFAWRHFTAPAKPEHAPPTAAALSLANDSPSTTGPQYRTPSATPATSTNVDALAAFEALKQRAKAGDAVSQRLLAQTYEACYLPNVQRAHFISSIQYLQKVNPDQAAELDRVLRLRLQQCDAVDGGAIIPMQLINGWYAHAAANGDLASRAVTYARQPMPLETATVTQFMDDLVDSGDPAAMYSLGNTLGERFVSNVRGPYASLVTGQIAGTAWVLAACRMGYDCGPDSIAATDFCLSIGRCQGESVEALMFAMVLADQDRAALEQKIQQILDATAP
ncbi:hypothetical protein [Stenotrophomonas sp. PS02289]|uniref:hypothetical protein n=1 Tax=Stenotrophomonas sp. PS02289 TaxID=2991422 RepID=UPI00249B651E|nr:hypothetical protein [Stenotrophomonas sp. PS02289]